MRVPGIFRWPGRIPAGRVESEAVVAAVDLLPTVARWAGASAPKGIDGEDVSDILTGKSRPRRTPLHWEWRFNIRAGYAVNRSPMLSIRDGKWKLLLNPDGSRTELYDIPADPMEQNNLAAANPAVTARLRGRAHGLAKDAAARPGGPHGGLTIGTGRRRNSKIELAHENRCYRFSALAGRVRAGQTG